MSARDGGIRPDPALHGNGVNCPACELRRDQLREAGQMDQRVPCNFCGETGRVGRAVSEIIKEAVSWARANHWPAAQERYDRHNAAQDTDKSPEAARDET